MLDTVAVSKTFGRNPDFDSLIELGWQRRRQKGNGKKSKYILPHEQNSKSPRLTIFSTPQDDWILNAEVSIGSWLFGSNLHLPVQDDIRFFMERLDSYIEERSGIPFDTAKARVIRSDFTKDFRVGDDCPRIIRTLAKLTLPRMERHVINDETVYFQNTGKDRTKKISIYDKHRERINGKASQDELEMSKGILRLEVMFRSNGITRLVNQSKSPNKFGKNLLNANVSEQVIADAEEALGLEQHLTANSEPLKKLLRENGTKGFGLVGYLIGLDTFGSELATIPNVSAKTLRRYEMTCRKKGVLSLE